MLPYIAYMDPMGCHLIHINIKHISEGQQVACETRTQNDARCSGRGAELHSCTAALHVGLSENGVYPQ